MSSEVVGAALRHAFYRFCGLLAAYGVASSLLILPSLAGGLAIVRSELLDDGDNDGFADTFVRMRVTVANTSGVELRQVSLHLSTDAPEVSCISRPLVFLGDVAAGELRRAADDFVFTVGDVDRQSLGLDEYADLTIAFEVTVVSNRLNEPAVASPIRLELDLDVRAARAPAVFEHIAEGRHL